MDETAQLKLQINTWIWETMPSNWTLGMCEELAIAILEKIEELKKRPRA